MLGSLFVNSRGFINLKPQFRPADPRMAGIAAGYEVAVTEDGKVKYKKSSDKSSKPSLVDMGTAKSGSSSSGSSTSNVKVGGSGNPLPSYLQNRDR